MKKQMTVIRKQQIRNEIETVGMLPRGGDDKFYTRKCECCGEKKQVQIWEGCDVIVTLCADCFESFN